MTDIQKENKSGGKVPNLRFPEFEGEWKVKKLGEVATNFMYGMNAAATVYDGENQYIRITDIDERTRLFTPNPLSSPDGELEDKYLLEKGDILFARTGASVGKSYLYSEKDGKIFFAGFLIRLNVKTENPYFIFSQTLTEKYQKWVLTMSMRSGQPGINAEEYKLLSIVIPSIQEQEKISSFLLLIDERIQTQNKIINDLKTLKTATAKKIFSQELRFKDDKGNEFLEWENILLGDTLDYEQPTNYLVSSTEYDDSFETPVVTAGKTFILGYTDDKNGVFEKEKLPVIIFDDFTTASQFVDFPFKAKSSAMKILKAKNDTNIRFIFEALQMINYEVGGHGRHWISVFSNLSIFVPSFPEQTKIANFLSAIDSKIDMENQLLQKLEEQKKYLLQNMFV